MKFVAAALAILVTIVGASPSAFAFAAIGLKASLDNCLNGNLSAAERIQACNQVIHTNVFSPETRAKLITIRGNAYFASGNLDGALDDYDKAIQLRPEFQPAVINRAVTLVRLGKCEAAGSELRAVLASDSHSWRALYARSLCETRAGDQAGAQSDLAAANAINPNAAHDFAPIDIPRWYR